MYINSDIREQLAQGLMDKRIELDDIKEKSIKAYEAAFQKVIEEVCEGKSWYEVTDCKIYDHLLEHKNPTKTVIEIMRQLKEEY